MTEELDEFDLLSKEPIYLYKVGNIISPLLRDISKIRKVNYDFFIGLINMNTKQYFELIKQPEIYDALSLEEQSELNIYDLIINNNDIRDMIEHVLDFFILEKVIFNDDYKVFVTYNEEIDENGEPIPVGVISKDNYLTVCNVILQRNHIISEKQDIEPKKYKNELARKLSERMEKAAKEKTERETSSLTFGKMVSKYCADNKNGINMLNVYDLTIYQFYDQWCEHNNIRQSFINDLIYTNTVSFSDIQAYDSQSWLK